MIHKNIHKRIYQFLWETDHSHYSKLQKMALNLARSGQIIAEEIACGQHAMRAMSLVYTTLLSLVPLLALSFSVLKAFGVHNQIEPLLDNFLSALGPNGEELTTQIIGFVENIKVGVLGTFGLIMLIYTVVSLVQKVESSLNYIWRVKHRRPFLQRYSEYLSIILIGPVLLFVAVGMLASLSSAHIVQMILSIKLFGAVIVFIGKIIPTIMIGTAFTFIYILVPNTRVKISSALIGGFSAAILWQLTGMLFASLVVFSGKFTAIYSGFAILFLFMIWVYLSWLILFIGSEVSFHHQHPHSISRQDKKALSGHRMREGLALTIMALIGEDFYKQENNWSQEAIAKKLGIPLELIQEITEELVDKKLIIESNKYPPVYLPARDMDKILLKDIFNAIRTNHISTRALKHKQGLIEAINNTEQAANNALTDALGERSLRSLVTGQS